MDTQNNQNLNNNLNSNQNTNAGFSDAELSNLPPPPKGVTGFSDAELSNLPPPPKGVTGKNEITDKELEKNKIEGMKLYAGHKPGEKPKNYSDVFGTILNLFTSATRGLGSNIGSSVVAPANIKTYSDALQDHEKVINNLTKQILQLENSGQDPSKFIEILNNYKGLRPKLADYVGPEVAQRMQEGFLKNLEEITGQSVGTILEALGGGVLESGVKTVASKTLTALEKINEVGKVTAKYSAAAGGASAMAEKEPIDKIAEKSIVSGIEGYLFGSTTAGAIEAYQPVKKALSTFIKDWKSGFNVKTPEQILKTPKEELYKLSETERNFYYSDQKEKIMKESMDKTGEITAEADKKIQLINEEQKKVSTEISNEISNNLEQSQKEVEKLQRDLAVSSRDKTLELRPKVLSAFKEQSDEFARLVDEEIGPYRNEIINQENLSNFIDEKFADNPKLAETIKTKLGVIDEIETSAGQAIKVKGDDTTVGKLYNRIRSLRGNISQRAKKGESVFTYSEKVNNDATSTIVDYLQSEKDIDLSKSREMWAKYAPVRDQIISEMNPFVLADTKTSKFASTLTKVASGKDVNNENFIKEIENLLNEPILDEQKSILSQIEKTKKEAMAKKIESENIKLENKFIADEKKVNANIDKKIKLGKISEEEGVRLKALEIDKLNTTLYAQRRTRIKRIIQTVLLLGGGWKLAHGTGLLP